MSEVRDAEDALELVVGIEFWPVLRKRELLSPVSERAYSWDEFRNWDGVSKRRPPRSLSNATIKIMSRGPSRAGSRANHRPTG